MGKKTFYHPTEELGVWLPHEKQRNHIPGFSGEGRSQCAYSLRRFIVVDP